MTGPCSDHGGRDRNMQSQGAHEARGGCRIGRGVGGKMRSLGAALCRVECRASASVTYQNNPVQIIGIASRAHGCVRVWR